MITTKTGDDGKSRWMGKVVDKDSPLLEAIGALDELQAVVVDEEIQKDLYGIMGEIGYGQVNSLELRVASLEAEIIILEKELKQRCLH